MKRIRKHPPNTVLVGFVRSKKDWLLVEHQGLYRIPAKSAPPIVRDGTIEFLAFYHPAVFEERKFTIAFYGKVNSLKVRTRIEVVPDEPSHPKAHVDYYVIGIESLIPLEEPIISLRHRRIIFIPTTTQKFFHPMAKEINYLFHDSPLEEILWDELVAKKISAERQFYLKISKSHFVLDFAIFCQNGNINVECDGDRWHNEKGSIEKDKDRNNQLESKGWAVLRFTTDMLTKTLPNSMDQITTTINKYGGVLEPNAEYARYIGKDNDGQARLFD